MPPSTRPRLPARLSPWTLVPARRSLPPRSHSWAASACAPPVGPDTTFGRVVKMVEEAEAHRADVQRFADKFTGYYLPVVAGIALLTFLDQPRSDVHGRCAGRCLLLFDCAGDADRHARLHRCRRQARAADQGRQVPGDARQGRRAADRQDRYTDLRAATRDRHCAAQRSRARRCAPAGRLGRALFGASTGRGAAYRRRGSRADLGRSGCLYGFSWHRRSGDSQRITVSKLATGVSWP